MKTFPESSFFQVGRAPALPSPGEVRDLNLKTGNVAATSLNYPPPVVIPSLGLVVKYGLSVSIVEAQTQIMLREEFHGRIPIPEIFGWTEDDGQTFIYMSLIEGDTLADRWGGLSDGEKRAICEELHRFVELLRTLEQDPRDKYVGELIYDLMAGTMKLINDIRQPRQESTDGYLRYRPSGTGWSVSGRRCCQATPGCLRD